MRRRKIDWPLIVLLVLAVIAVCYGLSTGSTEIGHG